MTERLTVEMVDDYIAREASGEETTEFFRLEQVVTSPVLIRAALVDRDRREASRRMEALAKGEAQQALEVALAERDAARADAAALTHALETAQARIDALVSERDAAPAEPSTAEEYETLTEAPSTYEALFDGADAIDARRKGDA